MVAQAFDRRHLARRHPVHERDARERRIAVDEHRARAAVTSPQATSSRSAQLVAQRLGERRADGRSTGSRGR